MPNTASSVGAMSHSQQTEPKVGRRKESFSIVGGSNHCRPEQAVPRAVPAETAACAFASLPELREYPCSGLRSRNVGVDAFLELAKAESQRLHRLRNAAAEQD